MEIGLLGEHGQLVQVVVDQVHNEEKGHATVRIPLEMESIAPKMEAFLMKQKAVLDPVGHLGQNMDHVLLHVPQELEFVQEFVPEILHSVKVQVLKPLLVMKYHVP